MRVLFSIHELGLNGAVTALLQQVKHLRGQGDTVTIMVPRLAGASAALEAAFRDTGATVIHSLASEHDVAIGCTVYAADVMNQLAGQMPTVWWIHEGRIGVNNVVAKPAVAQALGAVDRLIFPSRGVVERIWAPFLNNLPPGRVEVIPYVIPPPPPGEAVPRRAGTKRVVCVGSLYPRKRQADLVRAISYMPRAPLECVLIGEPIHPDAASGEMISARPERFVLTGGLQPDAVHDWLRGSDVFCLPSDDECMPIAPVEAAWHGVPVVLADLECYEGVWRHGVNALMHPVGDAELLSWNIRMLLETPTLWARLSVGAKAVPLRFSEQRNAMLFAAVLHEAIAAFRQ